MTPAPDLVFDEGPLATDAFTPIPRGDRLHKGWVKAIRLDPLRGNRVFIPADFAAGRERRQRGEFVRDLVAHIRVAALLLVVVDILVLPGLGMNGMLGQQMPKFHESRKQATAETFDLHRDTLVNPIWKQFPELFLFLSHCLNVRFESPCLVSVPLLETLKIP
jgi:hypothetical protein